MLAVPIRITVLAEAFDQLDVTEACHIRVERRDHSPHSTTSGFLHGSLACVSVADLVSWVGDKAPI